MSELTTTLAEIVTELTTTAFGDDTQVTAYKVAVIINGVFEATSTDKKIPTQMIYNYTRNGMVAKGKKGKATDIRYTKDEVTAFVTKYTSKYVTE
jgi:hypothetical protein